MNMMGIGLALVTIGATLRYAVDDEWDAVDVPTVGVILMVVGGIAFVTGAFQTFGKNSQVNMMRPPQPPPGGPARDAARPARRTAGAPEDLTQRGGTGVAGSSAARRPGSTRVASAAAAAATAAADGRYSKLMLVTTGENNQESGGTPYQ